MNKNKKILIGAIAVLAIIYAGYAISKKFALSNSAQQEPIKIGFIGPLTGDAVNLGQDAKLAVEMAAEEINNTGGINGRPIKVIYEDTKCNAMDGANAGNKLINIDKVSAIVGGLCSSETLAVTPMAERAKTVLVSYYSSAPSISKAGDYIFRVYPSDNFQGKFLADYIYNKGIRETAILYCLSDYCIGLRDTFSKRFKELGGVVTLEEGFEQAARDLRTQIVKIKETKPEAVYFASYPEATIPGLKQMKELGLDAKVFGADVWEDLKNWNEADGAEEGVFYTTPVEGKTSFKEKFMSKTGKSNMTLCASKSYDTINIIVNAMKKVGVDSEKIKNELYQVKNYDGVSGTIGFDENGDLTTASYMFKVIKDGKAVEVK